MTYHYDIRPIHSGSSGSLLSSNMTIDDKMESDYKMYLVQVGGGRCTL